MAGQHLRLGRDGQGRELAQALVHLPAVAALEVGAADAALKDRVTHEEIVFTQQHYAALSVAGGVPDSEAQLVEGDDLAFLVAAVRALEGQQLGSPTVDGLTVELCAPLAAQDPRTAHMVVVAVGAEDEAQPAAVLL